MTTIVDPITVEVIGRIRFGQEYARPAAGDGGRAACIRLTETG